MWLQIQLNVQKSEIDLLSEILMSLDSLSLTFSDTVDEPIFEPKIGETPLWQQTTITALFNENVDTSHIKSVLKKYCDINNINFEKIADKDWQNEVVQDFKPMLFGERLWIVPSWHKDVELAKDAIILNLDPGLAFGTGTHQTTSLCLEYLEQNPPIGLKVVDYGCGSGVLAIAAAKLGAAEVIAIDNDPQAVMATKDNAKKNNVNISVYLTDEEPKITADLLLANILAKPLQQLAPHFKTILKNNATIIMAGLLNNQAEAVKNAYDSFLFEDDIRKDDWTRLKGVKKCSIT